MLCLVLTLKAKGNNTVAHCKRTIQKNKLYYHSLVNDINILTLNYIQ